MGGSGRILGKRQGWGEQEEGLEAQLGGGLNKEQGYIYSSAETPCGGPSGAPGSGPSGPGSLPPGLVQTALPPKSWSRAAK